MLSVLALPSTIVEGDSDDEPDVLEGIENLDFGVDVVRQVSDRISIMMCLGHMCTPALPQKHGTPLCHSQTNDSSRP
jgi:hypothetical protein